VVGDGFPIADQRGDGQVCLDLKLNAWGGRLPLMGLALVVRRPSESVALVGMWPIAEVAAKLARGCF
jgi:hypothetical protein